MFPASPSSPAKNRREGLPGPGLHPAVTHGPAALCTSRGYAPDHLGGGSAPQLPHSRARPLAWIRQTEQDFTRSVLPGQTRTSCTDSAGYRTDGTRCAGIIQRVVPRTVPRERAGNGSVVVTECSDQNRRSDGLRHTSIASRTPAQRSSAVGARWRLCTLRPSAGSAPLTLRGDDSGQNGARFDQRPGFPRGLSLLPFTSNSRVVRAVS